MNWINVHPGKVPWNSSLDNCPPLMTVATSTMSSDPKNIYRKHLIPLLLFLQWDEKVRVKLRRLRQNLLLHYTGSDRTLSLLCIWLIGVTFGYAVSFPCSLHKALCNGGCDTQKVLVNGREAPRSSERAGYSANVTSRVGQHQACLETNWGTAHVKRGEKADGPTWGGGDLPQNDSHWYSRNCHTCLADPQIYAPFSHVSRTCVCGTNVTPFSKYPHTRLNFKGK